MEKLKPPQLCGAAKINYLSDITMDISVSELKATALLFLYKYLYDQFQ